MFKRTPFPAYYTPLDMLGWLALRVGGIGALVFLLLPIVVIIPLSFSDSSFLAYPIEGWSLRWYEEMWASDDWARAAKNSFIVAPLATVQNHQDTAEPFRPGNCPGQAKWHGTGQRSLRKQLNIKRFNQRR